MSRKRNRTLRPIALSAKDELKKEMAGRVLPWDLQSVLQIRQDIQSWTNSTNAAQSDEPKTWMFQQLLLQVMNDALLSSQRQNRRQQLFTSNFNLKKEIKQMKRKRYFLKNHLFTAI